jgi:hypothetical protein
VGSEYRMMAGVWERKKSPWAMAGKAKKGLPGA